jgi:hypothetical protein
MHRSLIQAAISSPGSPCRCCVPNVSVSNADRQRVHVDSASPPVLRPVRSSFPLSVCSPLFHRLAGAVLCRLAAPGAGSFGIQRSPALLARHFFFSHRSTSCRRFRFHFGIRIVIRRSVAPIEEIPLLAPQFRGQEARCHEQSVRPVVAGRRGACPESAHGRKGAGWKENKRVPSEKPRKQADTEKKQALPSGSVLSAASLPIDRAAV